MPLDLEAERAGVFPTSANRPLITPVHARICIPGYCCYAYTSLNLMEFVLPVPVHCTSCIGPVIIISIRISITIIIPFVHFAFEKTEIEQ